MTHQVKCRLYKPKLAPRRTKMEIPGWGGNSEPRRDGSREQPWHCVPFSESAQYGIEIFYPHDIELKVTTCDGKVAFDGDFGPPPDDGLAWPPFRSFGEKYYTYQLLLDLKVPEGMAIRTEPHPRFFSDFSDTTPIAVPALLRHWWPMVNFLVFKAPPAGCTHIFRPGEPMVQIIVVPAEPDFEIVAMSDEEAAERELQARRIHASRQTLSSDSHWTSSSDTIFDGTYRHIHRAAKARARENATPPTR